MLTLFKELMKDGGWEDLLCWLLMGAGLISMWLILHAATGV